MNFDRFDLGSFMLGLMTGLAAGMLMGTNLV